MLDSQPKVLPQTAPDNTFRDRQETYLNCASQENTTGRV